MIMFAMRFQRVLHRQDLIQEFPYSSELLQQKILNRLSNVPELRQETKAMTVLSVLLKWLILSKA